MVNSLKRAALCARVSTGEDRQDPETQLREAARRREIDVVLVWRYDRFARSTRALVNALKKFETLGVDFISCQEQIDTTTPQGEMVSALSCAAVARRADFLNDVQKVPPCSRAWV